MKVLVATDAHIFQTPDGKYWCNSIYGYSFWQRYLDIFESVRIVARVKKIKKLNGKKLEVVGPGVEVFGIPFYQGPKQLLKEYFNIQKSLKNVDDGCDVAIFRMPSQTAQMAYAHVRKNIIIGGEIVYDPYDDLQKKNQFILGLLRKRISYRLKKFCLKANGVSYVTEHSIQEHYPSKAHINGKNTKEFFETYYSSITLADTAFTGIRDYSNKNALKLALSSVAMNSDRKGEKVLIKTIKKVREQGYNVSAVIIGDGIKRHEFEQLASELCVDKYIKFTGMLASSDEVRNELLNADIFMFPTQAEGLPRGILEAMAVGMPVLSTPVGGIPEVIEDKYLFEPNDVDGFAKKIIQLFENTEELNRMSEVNYNKSKEYANSVLQKRRNDFYKALVELV